MIRIHVSSITPTNDYSVILTEIETDCPCKYWFTKTGKYTEVLDSLSGRIFYVLDPSEEPMYCPENKDDIRQIIKDAGILSKKQLTRLFRAFGDSDKELYNLYKSLHGDTYAD